MVLSEGSGAAYGATITAEHRWSCPNCTVEHVTSGPEPQTPFHPCAGLSGMLAPFVADGTRCKVVALVREDYVGGDTVRADENGRPIMAVVTVRDDGEDRAIMAPTAQGEAHAHGLG